MRRGVLFAMVALALLTLDFVRFPDLLEDRIVLDFVSANAFVAGDVMTLGKYRLHTLRASSGSIADASYMQKLGPRIDGLAITVFSAADDKPVAIGTLGDSVRSLLLASDAENLVTMIRNSPTFPIGKVQALTLQTPPTTGPLSGIRVILVLRAKQGNDRQAKDALKTGLVELLTQAGNHSISGLLLPALTVAPDEKDSPSFDDFYQYLFDALRITKVPRNVDISFFDGWSKASLENATTALNAHWSAHLEDHTSFFSTLHRFQLRLLLIGLAICFIASSRRIELKARTALILATAFTLSLLGSFKTVETLAAGLGETEQGIALIVMTLVLAIAFPEIVSWSVKDLFSSSRKKVET